ncbi:MAG: hypothetical protein H6Q62_456 [Firmicutes bacterium]|nr:hypothetical protein [Bacillota bacterium]
MKKYTFSLAALRKSRQKQEQEQRRELALIQSRIDQLNDTRDQLLASIDKLLTQRDQQLKTGAQPLELQNYLFSYSQMADQRDVLDNQIRQAGQDHEKCRNQLIALMVEIKGLDKLEQKQWAEFQTLEAQAEEAVMNDMVSFRLNPWVGGRTS